MAKKAVTPVEDLDQQLAPLPATTSTDEGFDDDFQEDQKSSLETVLVTHQNPNVKLPAVIGRGGYTIGLEQKNVSSDVVFPVGPKEEILNGNDETYEAYAATELEICVLAATDNFWLLKADLWKDKAWPIPLPKGSFLGKIKKDGKAISFSKKLIYFFIKGDPYRKVYVLSTKSNTSTGLEAVHKELLKACATYRDLEAKRNGKKPSEVNVKGTFLFWIKLGVAKPFSVSSGDTSKGKASTMIAPPEIKWNGGKPPVTWEDFLQYRVTSAEYNEFKNHAQDIRDFLKNDDRSPVAPRQIPDEILEDIGFEHAMIEGKLALVPAGSQLAAPAKRPAISAPMAREADEVNAPDKTVAQWFEEGNSLDSLDKLFASNGVTRAQVLKSMEATSVDGIMIPIVDAIIITKDDNK